MWKVTLLLCFAIGGACGVDVPTWPDQYKITGTLELPYVEIVEPFSAFFDKTKNRSRIDYYGVLVQTIQLGGNATNPAGASYKVAPMTDDIKNITNVKTCFTMAGSPLDPVGPQSILPDLTGFAFVGEGKMNEQDCNIFQMVTKNGLKKNTYTLWVMTNSKKQSVPVRYEMMGYDSLLGSHYDKYYLNYDVDSFDTDPLQDNVFDPKSIPGITECHGFPGPGDAEHNVLFNPMQEYINNHDSHIDDMFHHFKKRHSKEYKDDTEHMERMHTFRQNVRFVHSTNRAGLSYRVAINHLADVTDKEFKAMRGYRHTPGHHGGLPFVWSKEDLKETPDYVDWRLYGAVTPVKDQAVCGSCWSFGTSGAVEGAHFIKTGELVRLSQQALMDCSWGEGNNACDGGEDFRAYEWIQRNGLPTEESYGQYLAQDGYCHFKNATIGAQMTGYVNVTPGDLQALRVAIAKNGPVSVAIDASHKSLSFYSNGVYYEKECGSGPDSLDHAVLAVGYGVLNGQPYWLIKNSWSTYWGNDGYVLMAQKDNNCGVATTPTFVVV